MRRTGKKTPKPAPTPAPAEQQAITLEGGWTKSVKLRTFVKALGHHGNVSKALHAAQASRAWIYEKRERDIEFADAFERARRCGLEVLKDEAHRRAYEGVREPVFYQGEVVAHVQKYSDILLMFLIKQADPSYRERGTLELANESGRPFMFQMMLHPDAVAAAKATP